METKFRSEEMSWLDKYRSFLFEFSLWVSILSSLAISVLHYFKFFQYSSVQHALNCFIFSLYQAIILALYLRKIFQRELLVWASIIPVQLIFLSNLIYSTEENVRILWFGIAYIPAQFIGGSRMGLPIFASSILIILGYYFNTDAYQETDIISSISILSMYYFFIFYLLRLLQTADAEITSYNSELEGMVAYDGLTGIFNRRYFDQRISGEWKGSIRSKSAISLLMIDIDNFKKYNDLYGHIAGDECLRKITKSLGGSIVRAADVLCRYGGEEFSVILPNTEEEGARNVARRLKDSIEALEIEHKASDEGNIVTISIGVSTMQPALGDNQEELLIQADNNLYAAKRQGKNRVV